MYTLLRGSGGGGGGGGVYPGIGSMASRSISSLLRVDGVLFCSTPGPFFFCLDLDLDFDLDLGLDLGLDSSFGFRLPGILGSGILKTVAKRWHIKCVECGN